MIVGYLAEPGLAVAGSKDVYINFEGDNMKYLRVIVLSIMAVQP